MCQNMIGFLLKYFPGNLCVNGIVNGFSEMFGYATAGIMYNKFGIKKALRVGFGIAAVGGIAILFFFYQIDYYGSEIRTSD